MVKVQPIALTSCVASKCFVEVYYNGPRRWPVFSKPRKKILADDTAPAAEDASVLVGEPEPEPGESDDSPPPQFRPVQAMMVLDVVMAIVGCFVAASLFEAETAKMEALGQGLGPPLFGPGPAELVESLRKVLAVTFAISVVLSIVVLAGFSLRQTWAWYLTAATCIFGLLQDIPDILSPKSSTTKLLLNLATAAIAGYIVYAVSRPPMMRLFRVDQTAPEKRWGIVVLIIVAQVVVLNIVGRTVAKSVMDV